MIAPIMAMTIEQEPLLDERIRERYLHNRLLFADYDFRRLAVADYCE
jgi:hypothetical protein